MTKIEEGSMLTTHELSVILDLLKRNYNNTTTALNFINPFQLLVSTMLAAQSTDVQVNKVTNSLFKKYPDAYSFLKLTTSQLEDKIKTVGLFKSKAKNILAAFNFCD